MKNFSAVLLCLALVSAAATTQTNSAGRSAVAGRTAKVSSPSPAAPNESPAEREVPRSVFVAPTVPREGRDPFYPSSVRPYGAALPTTRTNQQPAVAAPVELALKGISGTRERPLAIINNQTFAAGEDGVVLAGTRRVHIRCSEINLQTESVVIQMGNERRALWLKQPK